MNLQTFLWIAGSPDRRAVGAWERLFLLALLLVASVAAQAENTNSMVKPPVPLPGGLGVHPVITSIVRTQDVVTVEWFGIQGPFQLLSSPSAADSPWTQVGESTFGSKQTVPATADLGLFRVLGGRPVSTDPRGGTVNYIGARACLECHPNSHQNWSQTAHAKAFETLRAINQHKNPSCVTCHTVGHGTPAGFKDEVSSPHLMGVQCENCHGPGASHVANIRDISVRPKVTIAAEVCGGCHNGFHHPTFDEWKQSGHAHVTPDVAESIVAQGESRMNACGVCHSGAVRESLLKQLTNPSVPLPSREDAAYFGVTCSVCHDPHENTPHSHQLRNPTYSTNHFSYSTSANTSFAAQYNPDIQVCAQCHNMRGARWQDTSRPPHHSPQYNILVGQGAYDLGQSSIATHGLKIPNQCAQCHTHPHEADPATATSPNYTGHRFEMTTFGCSSQGINAANCHGSTPEEAAEVVEQLKLIEATQSRTKNLIEEVRVLLDRWATNKAPAQLREKYGRLGWEYNNPGEVSNPAADPALRGPTTAEQAQVPDAIKQARMNLYLVQYDGSFGVHNGKYARHLLEVARTNVTTELNAP